jgi:cell division transport system permease protein
VGVRLRFFFGEATTSLRNNLATTLAATVTVLIVMFWLGVFVALGTYMYRDLEHARNDVHVSVYLADGATAHQVHALERRLAANPEVRSWTFVSKTDAVHRLERTLPEAHTIMKEVPGYFLPASLEVKLKDPAQAKAVAAAMRNQAGVERGKDGVTYGEKTVDRFLHATSIIEAVIGGLILLLAIAAVLLIANTIRLSIFARRREIEVMKLVGATNWFVRFPFMLEGMICGLAGAVLSIGLLWGAYVLVLRDWLESNGSTGVSGGEVHAISFWVLAALLLLAGTALGATGSGLTMRRFLRV